MYDAVKRGDFEGDCIKRAKEPIPHEIYKLRLPNLDAKVGKSNGYRVIYFVATEELVVIFMTIYYKKEEANVPDKYINGLIDGCLSDMFPDDESITDDVSVIEDFFTNNPSN